MSIITFIKGSYEELRERVTWTKYRELQSNSVLVIVASIIFAILIGTIDLGFDQLLGLFYKTF